MTSRVSLLILGLLSCYKVASYDPNDRLHLTPYIRQGNITTARELSSVTYRDDNVATSHSGFITVDERLGNHLFFWFFPAINSDPRAPLVVWLNGGPGEPSMLGLFHENGPLRLQPNGNGTFMLKIWNGSWAETFSMLYIDNPVGVGYSYSDSGEIGCRTTQEGYSKDLYEFIQQFYIMFPEYLQRELYIGGQSYAGKYVTSLASRLHKQILNKKSNIPLTGIYLGAPFIDPYSQSKAMSGYFYSSGAISLRQHRDHQKLVDSIFDQLRVRQISADQAVTTLLMNNSIVGLWANNYNARSVTPYEELWYLMNTPAMRTLVHAGNTTFVIGDDGFRAKFNVDWTKSVKAELAVLLNTYKVLIYNGDLDAVVSSVMVDAALAVTRWSFKDRYGESVRDVWTDGYKLKGFFTWTGKFCRVVIHGAGHNAPYDQPVLSLDMMSQFIKNGCIQNENILL
uniref:Carboxypeptidase n=1 Tax=Biomphalaria glabrata TaxID=6526 RepID=A0A2C9JED0_BIOGL